MDLLRFTTAGSVDDGKSTLIGRLLYDSKSIFEDQLEAMEESSRRRGDENVNLALLTDGLKAEREQGITIDVAYRYFATPKRKFIIADTPGHIQYTRNMVTGASTANLAIILIDARKGVIEQTKRHSFIANLLRIQHERQRKEYFPGLGEYISLFGLTKARAARLKPSCLIMHPGPINRGVEIDSDVADGHQSVILEQVTNGIAVRMAVLYSCAGGAGVPT